MSKEDEIIDSFMRCKDPIKQIQTTADLCGCDIKTVIDVLREAGKIPKNTTTGNYKKVLLQLETVGLTEELAAHVRSMHEMGCTKRFIAEHTGLLMKQIDRALGAKI